ncbi:MAG: gamma-glutamylcyclotransferase [Alphaproteobacteria bacterium]|nr:gamma-glutamylcyclotransferase [Alphaproteobacteria bacterium]
MTTDVSGYRAYLPVGGGSLFVFVYGSLIWNPEFRYSGRRVARIFGYRRDLGLYSLIYRGSPEFPGLVCGLDRGGSCRGILYEVSGGDAEGVLEYLWGRELVLPDAYFPVVVRCYAGGDVVDALTFVLNRGHSQYAGGLSDEERVAIILRARGRNGTSREYLRRTNEALGDAGIPCGRLLALERKADQHEN